MVCTLLHYLFKVGDYVGEKVAGVIGISDSRFEDAKIEFEKMEMRVCVFFCFN